MDIEQLERCIDRANAYESDQLSLTTPDARKLLIFVKRIKSNLKHERQELEMTRNCLLAERNALESVRQERDEALAKLAAMESQAEPADKPDHWAVMSPDRADQYRAESVAVRKDLGFSSDSDEVAPIDLLSAIRQIRADRSRITEQDAREIAHSALSFWRNTVNLTLDTWIKDHAPALLNKLNADRKQAEWEFCPECGSYAIYYEEGRHKHCKQCHQDWFSDLDYSRPVASNLNRLFSAKQMPAVVVPDYAKIIRDLAQEFKEAWPDDNGKYAWLIGYSDEFKADLSHSQQSSVAEAERFCDAHCTWRDHHPDCPRHESERPDSDGE